GRRHGEGGGGDAGGQLGGVGGVGAGDGAGIIPAQLGFSPDDPRAPAQLCRETVAGCELYVGLIGFRYGSPVREDPGRSYVELEYDTATELGLPRLIFPIGDQPQVVLPRAFFVDGSPGRQGAGRRPV